MQWQMKSKVMWLWAVMSAAAAAHQHLLVCQHMHSTPMPVCTTYCSPDARLLARLSCCCCRLCSAEDTRRSEDGAVKKCMIANHAELSEDCQRELGRSMHMAFFVWQPQALLTAACDDDIQKLCLSKSKGMEVTPGAVAVCISEIVSGVTIQSTRCSASCWMLCVHRQAVGWLRNVC